MYTYIPLQIYSVQVLDFESDLNTTIPWALTYLYVHLDDVTPVTKLKRGKKLSNGEDCFIQQFEQINDPTAIVYRKESITAHTTKHPLAIYTKGKFIRRRNTKLLVKYAHLNNNALISRWNNVHDNNVCAVLQMIQTVKSVPFLHLLNHILSEQLTQQSVLLSQHQQQQQQQQQYQKSSQSKPRYVYHYINTYDDDEQKEEPPKDDEDLLPPQLQQPQNIPSPNDDSDNLNDDENSLPPFMALINKYSHNTNTNNNNNSIEDLLPPNLNEAQAQMDISDNEREEGEQQQPLSQKRTIEGMSEDNDDDNEEENNNKNDSIPQQINNRFFQKSFARKARQKRKMQKANKLLKKSKDKAAQRADKDKHRNQIEFTTKYKFCRVLERTGQPVATVWKKLREEGWDLGKGYSNIYRWKTNGSRYYLNKIRESGNGFRLKYIQYIYM